MRLAFAGSPAVAVHCLEALIDAGHEISVVVTQPDRRRGRGGSVAATPVKLAALERGITVVHDASNLIERASDLDLGVVVAFGRLIATPVLDALEMINLHFSMLPRWRGAAPVERAILQGDPSSGVCVMKVAAELDAGPVYRCQEVAIGDDTTAAELRNELSMIGAGLLVACLADGLGDPQPQAGEVSYATKIGVEDLHIDWDSDPVTIHRQIRVGGAWTTFGGRRMKILGADLIDGRLVIRSVQPEGRGPMDYEAWRRGVRARDGEWFE